MLRLVFILWILGVIVLGLVAMSTYLYSSEAEPSRTQRMHTRLRTALMWPIAMFSAAGRARLRSG